MSMVMPVIQDDADEARNSAAAATSSGWPRRPSGKDAPRAARSSADIHLRMRSFSIADGARQLTRMPSDAHSPARWRLNAATPAFAAAYAAEDFAAWRAADEDIVMITPEWREIMSGRNAASVRNVEASSLSTAARQCSPVSTCVGTGM